MFDPDASAIAQFPNPFRMIATFLRANEPFVMVNLLAYKAQATGEHRHLSGEAAYAKYVASVEKVQGPMGSKLLWGGRSVRQRVGESPHGFVHFGLLQYASPRTFLSFVAGNQGDHQARRDGLAGQWLFASTTLESAQAPETDHVALMEVFGFDDRRGQTSADWRQRRQAADEAAGAVRVWRGRIDRHVIGSSSPPLHEVVVTAYPTAEAIDAAFEQAGPPQGMRVWWAFEADTTVDLLPGLREP
ncbi:MAG: hypothetical protein AAF211_03195 [Myxococcota bacterium]